MVVELEMAVSERKQEPEVDPSEAETKACSVKSDPGEELIIPVASVNP
jgi:hypothetical protein